MNKNVKTTIRIDEDLYNMLLSEMKDKGENNLSRYIRNIIHSRKHQVQDSDLKKILSELEKINRTLINEINHHGNNINQIARNINVTGAPQAYRKELMEEMQKTYEKLSEVSCVISNVKREIMDGNH